MDAAVVRITDAQRRATCLVEFNIIKYVKVFTTLYWLPFAVHEEKRKTEFFVWCENSKVIVSVSYPYSIAHYFIIFYIPLLDVFVVDLALEIFNKMSFKVTDTQVIYLNMCVML